jgi:hypothetical protein
LISFCLKYVPKEMNFTEGLVFVSALTRMELLDIDNFDLDYIDKIFIKDHMCTLDDDGRIIKLMVMNVYSKMDYYKTEIPAIIGHLQRLVELEIGSDGPRLCFISKNLPQLHTLRLDGGCPEDILDGNIPLIQMRLQHLKKLNVDGYNFESIRFHKWMTTQLPNLEELEFDNFADLIGHELARDEDEIIPIDTILEFISSVSNPICFRDSLKCLSIRNSNLNSEDFKLLMSDLVPRFKKLSTLDLSYNEIGCVGCDDAEIVRSSLRVLNLCGNPVFKNMNHDQVGKTAMLNFLKINNTVHNLGGFKRDGRYDPPVGDSLQLYHFGPGVHSIIDGSAGDYDSEIEYALRLNHAGRGRIIVETSNGDARSTIPSSMFPTVLERAYENSYQVVGGFVDETGEVNWNIIHDYNKNQDRNADGLFYLFRRGLVEHPHFIGNLNKSNKNKALITEASQQAPLVQQISHAVDTDHSDCDGCSNSGSSNSINSGINRGINSGSDIIGEDLM